MVRIAICDDDGAVVAQLKQYLASACEKNLATEIVIEAYCSGESFLEKIREQDLPHIVFLDIEMGGMNGVEVGRALKRLSDGDDVILIYMSSHDSYYEGIAHVGSFRFLSKPLVAEKTNEVIERAIAKALKDGKRGQLRYHYHVNKDVLSIQVNDIAYLKCKNKLIEIYAWDRERGRIVLHDRTYASVASAMEQLPRDCFVQCERSHVINMNHVGKMAGGLIVFADKDETSVPIGRTHKERVRMAFTKYRGGQYG